VLDRFARREIDEDGVELEEVAGFAGGEIARLALGEAALGRSAAGVRPSPQGRHGLDDAARHEIGDDPPDPRVADREALRAQE
jgi:hypothetical protein